MAEADLSKIVNLIMENPKLIEQIKNLASQNSENKESEAEAAAEAVADLLVRGHGEGGRLLTVEGTQSFEIGACPL